MCPSYNDTVSFQINGCMDLFMTKGVECMITSRHGNVLCITGIHISTVVPSQIVTNKSGNNVGVSFVVSLIRILNKQSRCRWFATYVTVMNDMIMITFSDNHLNCNWLVSSLRPRDAYMRHQTKPSLVQIMACRLFGAKPLSEPMLWYC